MPQKPIDEMTVEECNAEALEHTAHHLRIKRLRYTASYPYRWELCLRAALIESWHTFNSELEAAHAAVKWLRGNT